MSKIIVGFSKPTGTFKPAAWLIRKWQKTEFSHVYIKIPRASGIDVVYQASGAQVNFMGAKAFKAHAIVVKEFEFEITPEARDKFFDEAIENSGAPYSVLMGLGMGLARCFSFEKNPFYKKGEFVCSALVALALPIFGLKKDISKDMSMLNPKDIYELCVGMSGNANV
jgi:hypothetical protein